MNACSTCGSPPVFRARGIWMCGPCTRASRHPDGCHVTAPALRDCESDGHESCRTCARRAVRDEQVWRDGGIVVTPQH